MPRHRVTALVLAVLLPSTVTLFARLHHPVAANRLLRLGEAAFGAARLRVQDHLDGLERTRRETVVVALVSGRGACKHDEVAVFTARCASVGVVLEVKGWI
jgi:hypothetical protein